MERQIDEFKAKMMYENASSQVDDVWKPCKFSDVDSTVFLSNYCHVVFVSGFRYSVVRKHFPAIRKAFKNFDLDALSKLASIDANALPIRNKPKATGFLKGAKAIAAEGFDAFKKRLEASGMDALEDLPGIGKITKRHLAMAIGLVDTAKPDVWLTRCAEACSTDVETLISFLSKEYGESKQHVDAVLWEYCQQFQEIPPMIEAGR